MATPPFNIDQTVPSDAGIVSQFPLQERTMRDNAKSWLATDHNTNGRHAQVSLDQTTPDISTAPTATTLMIWSDTVGQAKCFWGGTGAGAAAEMLSVPPGSVLPFASPNLPVGYLWANGQAVSRTTYARLFSAISTFYGSGDGSTTFNVPDMRCMVPAGRDNMGAIGTRGLITAGGGNFDSTLLGNLGGAQNVTLTTTTLPTHAHTMNFVSGLENQFHTHSFSGTTAAAATGITASFGGAFSNSYNSGGITGYLNSGGPTSVTINDPTHSHSFSGTTATESAFHNHNVTGTSDAAGSGGAHINVQPTLIVNYIIKV